MSNSGMGLQIIAEPKILKYSSEDDGTFPNNPLLSILLYKNVLQLPEKKAATSIEELFKANDW